MDIEGAELLALRGAGEVMSAYKLKLLLEIEEAHTQKQGYKPQGIFAMLAAYGYRDVYRACEEALVQLDMAALKVAERPFAVVYRSGVRVPCE